MLFIMYAAKINVCFILKMFFPILFRILLNVKGLLWSEGNKNTRVHACMFSFHLLAFYIISICTNKM